MKNLRLYQIFDWFLVALSYVAVILLYKGGVLYENNPETIEVMNNLRIGGLALYGVLLFLQIPVYVMGIFYGITAKESMAKHNMIVKLVSVLFFVINWLALSSLSTNSMNIERWLPFLLIFLSFIITFSIMFRSSLPNIVYFVRSYTKKHSK